VNPSLRKKLHLFLFYFFYDNLYLTQNVSTPLFHA